MKWKYPLLLLMFMITCRTTPAQEVDSLRMVQHGYELVQLKDTAVWVPGGTPMCRLYLGNGLDAFIVSTARLGRGRTEQLTPIRFSAFLHLGVHLSYDFNEHIGVYTGLGVKNIGFIEKVVDSTIKRRVYTVGMPVGIKFGNVVKRNFGFIGAGVDVPFHYKEKGFVRRDKKQKTTGWMSPRTAQWMPYGFVGLSVSPGITFKLQYYPGNFLNPDFIEPLSSSLWKPYQDYRTQLLLFSMGIDFHYRRRPEVKYVDDGE